MKVQNSTKNQKQIVIVVVFALENVNRLLSVIENFVEFSACVCSKIQNIFKGIYHIRKIEMYITFRFR